MTATVANTIALANGVRIDLLTSGEELLGFGEIRIGDVRIRSVQAPMHAQHFRSIPPGGRWEAARSMPNRWLCILCDKKVEEFL